MKKGVILLTCLLVINGCMVRLVYNHLDWIIPWYISDYITFDDGQRTLLEGRLLAQLGWHRSTQLVLYVDVIKQIKAAFIKGMDLGDLDRFHHQLRQCWRKLVRQITPDIVELLSGASDDQIHELLANLTKRQEKFKKEYIDEPPDQLRRKKAERMQAFLEFIVGDLSEQQEKAVAQWSASLKPIAVERLAYMRYWQERFGKLLKTRRDKGTFGKALAESLFFYRKDWPSQFKAKADYNRELTKRFFLDIVQKLTAQQKKQGVEHLDDLADVLDKLAQMAANE